MEREKQGGITRYHYDRGRLCLETDGTDAVLGRPVSPLGHPLVRQGAAGSKEYCLSDAHQTHSTNKRVLPIISDEPSVWREGFSGYVSGQ